MARVSLGPRVMGVIVVMALAAASCTHGASPAPSPTPSGPNTCVASDVSVVPGAYHQGAKSTTGTLVFTNTSATLCFMKGTPGLQLLDDQKKVMPSKLVTGGAHLPRVASRRIPLKPHASASFYYAYVSVPTGSQTCNASSSIRVFPPGSDTSANIKYGMAPCGGKIAVSAVRPGVVLK